MASYGGEVVGDWRFPNSSFYNLFIEGDYFVAYFVAPVRRAIVDWRQQKGVIIDFVDEEVCTELALERFSLIRLHRAPCSLLFDMQN